LRTMGDGGAGRGPPRRHTNARHTARGRDRLTVLFGCCSAGCRANVGEVAGPVIRGPVQTGP
jgi:hypothetical protein